MQKSRSLALINHFLRFEPTRYLSRDYFSQRRTPVNAFIKQSESNSKLKIPPLLPFSSYRHLQTGSKKRDTTLPQLIYLQYPWRYFVVKLNLMRLKLFWDRTFKEDEFKMGTKQATVVMADFLREQNLTAIRELTTDTGFKQILRDLLLSQGDPRMQLLNFRVNDIKQAIPVRTHFVTRNGQKHCIIDMFLVGMRNVSDFDPMERQKILDYVRRYEKSALKLSDEIIPRSNDRDNTEKRRVVFAEILARFYREYGANKQGNWTVAFYKIASFDVLKF